MAGLEFRGPFLLVFALGQQLGTLLQQAMADAPLPPNEFAVYSALRLMQPTTPTQLAGALGMKATTLSSVLVRMSRSGHLKRRRNPADGRSVILTLSASGVRVTEACFATFGVAIEAFRRQLRIDESVLLADLEAMSQALARASADLADSGSDEADLAGAGG
ncbi:MAG: Winged helix DNA-binding domain [Pseudonocardiales bacterium]|jgi:DNA-binding MarR family transcriptional regulator|nr:Winged helix DNA-binding domain [Pseudonocardiales bacterium]